MLAREVLRLRSTIPRTQPWDVMVDLFFYRDPEEVEQQAKDEAAAREEQNAPVEAVAPSNDWDAPAPQAGGAGDWGAPAQPMAGGTAEWGAAVPAPQVGGGEWGAQADNWH